MQPKRSQITTGNTAIPAKAMAPRPDAAPGTSPAADLQHLIQAHYAGVTDDPLMPLAGRLAIMFSISAALWATIAVAVRYAGG